jgi:hypothetical protein
MLAFGAHVTFEPVDGTDFGGVMELEAGFGLRVAAVGKKEQRTRNQCLRAKRFWKTPR